MAATVNKRWEAVLGPVKAEFIHITSDGTNDDTSVSTLMANPSTVSIVVANDDLGGTASGASVTKSGKALTLRDCANGVEYVLIALGY